jgi:hypothetical protein
MSSRIAAYAEPKAAVSSAATVQADKAGKAEEGRLRPKQGGNETTRGPKVSKSLLSASDACHSHINYEE